MIAILGLLVLVVAVLVAVTGVLSNTGSSHPLGGDFTVAGLHLTGLSTGQLFLYGITVGAVAMLGLSMLLGTFSRQMASRGSERKLKGSRQETATLRLDHERLTQQLEDERAEHGRSLILNPTQGMDDPGQAPTPSPDGTVDPAAGERSSLLHRIGYRKGRQP